MKEIERVQDLALRGPMTSLTRSCQKTMKSPAFNWGILTKAEGFVIMFAKQTICQSQYSIELSHMSKIGLSLCWTVSERFQVSYPELGPKTSST